MVVYGHCVRRNLHIFNQQKLQSGWDRCQRFILWRAKLGKLNLKETNKTHTTLKACNCHVVTSLLLNPLSKNRSICTSAVFKRTFQSELDLCPANITDLTKTWQREEHSKVIKISELKTYILIFWIMFHSAVPAFKEETRSSLTRLYCFNLLDWELQPLLDVEPGIQERSL